MKDTALPVLVVDLDGTLLRTDMLFETFWGALGSSWREGAAALGKLRDGRAALKAYLTSRSEIDVTTLPYNDAVIERIREHRQGGGSTALVTASNQALANKVADHLGLFDAVHGSDAETNLKGETKARFLDDMFGRRGYIYMGDSAADLRVWPSSSRAITVNASQTVKRQADALDVPVEHLTDAPTNMRDYLKALRPHQWMKNTLIFLPMLAAQAVTFGNILWSLMAFIAFSLVASSVYVLNDLLDLASDRAHPRKCKRPFAAGRIPIAHGSVMAGGLLAAGFLISALLGPVFLLVMSLYYLVTCAYSMALKRIAMIDICVLAGLYTIRILAGGAATGIFLSVWLLAFSVFLFFSLAAVKRLAELIDNREAGKTDIAGRGYSTDDIGIVQAMAIAAGYVSVLVMTLYTNASTTLVNYSTPEALWGISAVLLYWISRTIFLTHRGRMHDDPVIFAVKDSVSQLCLILILVFAGVAIAL